MARLVEYVLVVGLKRPRVDSTQSPELLRKYPEQDHKDFPLPPDVVFFCQPEGCTTASKRFSLRQMNSFVFTLTDKETGITRYGICCNFYRPCLGTAALTRRHSKLEKTISSSSNGSTSSMEENSYSDYTTTVQSRNRAKMKGKLCRAHTTANTSEAHHIKHVYKNSVFCYSLTSICIISSYPFFSTFRECLFVLRKLVDSRCYNKDLGPLWNKGSFAFFDSNQNMGSLPLVECRNWSLFFDNSFLNSQKLKSELLEIDDWIKNFLKIPLPIAGVNRVEVELLPRHIQPPLTFALPEKSRFSFLDFPIHLPFELLGVETCLKILTCIMLEYKVVLQSSDYNALSISVMALTSMLYPLEYMFPIIPLLPTCMRNAEQLLLAPTPYVIGIPSSFFHLKTNFLVPTDVMIIDLDTNKMNVPLTMDEIPSLPEPEGTTLRTQLRQCLSHLSFSPQPRIDLDKSSSFLPHPKAELIDESDTNHSIYGNDMDSVDIAVRAALVKFFCSPNVLANFTQHTRVLRLFPRPVVAFLKESFAKSRKEDTPYIRALIDTQAVEFFAEYMVNPDNTVFRKVQNGILDPRIIGDKPKWYSHYVQPLYFQVHNPHSRLGCDLYEDSDDSSSDTEQNPSTINEEDEGEGEGGDVGVNEGGHNHDDDENCSCCSSFDDTDDEDDEYPFDDARDSMSLFDGSYAGLQADEINLSNSVTTMPAYRSEETLTKEALEANGKTPHSSSKATSNSSTESGNVESPSMTEKQQTVKKLSNLFGSIKPKLTSRLSIDSTTSVVSVTSLHSINTEFSPASNLYKAQSISSIQKSPLDRTIMEGFESIRNGSGNVYNSDNQQMITEVVGYVKSGDGIGWLSTKKLRRVLNYETLRQYLINQMDMDRHNSTNNTLNDIHISRNVYRGYMELLKLIVEGYEYSVQWRGIGGLTSVFSFMEITHRYFCGKRYKDDSTITETEVEVPNKVKEETRDVMLRMEANHDSGSAESLHFHRDMPGLQHTSQSVNHKPTGKENGNLKKKEVNGENKNATKKTKDLYLVCKSNSSGQKRFYDQRLCETVMESAGKGVSGTGRRYLYEGIVRNRSTLWDNLDFWEQAFLDAVSAEREATGMDVNPTELMARYKTLSPKERKIIEEDEDELLGILLHNMIAFMAVMAVNQKDIKFKVRRLLAKSHIGIAQSQRIDELFSSLNDVTGNDIDLLVPRSKRIKIQNFVVHLGDTQTGFMFFLEVREDCLVLKNTQGNMIERWWYENIVNLSCSPKTKVLCVWIRTGEDTDLQKICTKKCKMLYNSIKDSMKRAAERLNKEGKGISLGGDFKVVDSLLGQQGVLKVTLEGVSVVFVERKLCVDMKQLKNCSAKQNTLIVEEYVPHNQSIIKHQFYTEEANEICYAILCLFSYIAAAKNSGKQSGTSSSDPGSNSH